MKLLGFESFFVLDMKHYVLTLLEHALIGKDVVLDDVSICLRDIVDKIL